MYIKSNLSIHDYRNTIKTNLENFVNPYCEHFSGIFLGKSFYLTHHSEHEFGSRFPPKCSAVGYMKETENGCELHFRTFRGLFCPFSFLITLLIFVGIALLVPNHDNHPLKQILIGIVLAVLFASISTLMEITT